MSESSHVVTPGAASEPGPAARELSRPVGGRGAWFGADLTDSEEWIYRLSTSDVKEIVAAIQMVRASGRPLIDIRREHFPLPTLGPVLDTLQSEVMGGRGFALIRDLPVVDLTRADTALVYWGLGAYFGVPVSQNAKGHLLGHVKDIGHDPENPLHRIYATHARQRYHTDSCDIVGLLCLCRAKRGGLSSLASSVTVHDEMLRERPDLVNVLTRPFAVDRKGEVPPGKLPYYHLAVFHHHAGHLTTIFARDFIEGAQRFAEVARLTAAQVEALDRFEATAARPRVRLDMELQPGDMQFLHNHQIVHARTDFEDHADPARRRHLLRLWLSPPNGRPLPPAFEERYGPVDVFPRGGIRVAGMTPSVPLEAE